MSTEINPMEALYQAHSATVKYGLDSINQHKLEKAGDTLVRAVKERRHVYTIGNGASAAIAQHWACDHFKGCSNLNPEEGKFLKLKTISLSANIPLMTAISNDISYDEVYAYQVERLGAPSDVLVTISSSGNSPNVVRAIEAAIKEKMFVISLTGFTGGKAKELADNYEHGISLHVDVQEYEAAEDVHQAIMHMLAKYIRLKLWT